MKKDVNTTRKITQQFNDEFIWQTVLVISRFAAKVARARPRNWNTSCCLCERKHVPCSGGNYATRKD